MHKLTDQMIHEVEEEIDDSNEAFCAAAMLIKAGSFSQRKKSSSVQMEAIGELDARHQLGTFAFSGLVSVILRENIEDADSAEARKAGEKVLKLLEKHVPWLKEYLKNEALPVLMGYKASGSSDVILSLQEIGSNIADAVLSTIQVDPYTKDIPMAMHAIETELAGRKQASVS